jgi:hypothetical protein
MLTLGNRRQRKLFGDEGQPLDMTVPSSDLPQALRKVMDIVGYTRLPLLTRLVEALSFLAQR